MSVEVSRSGTAEASGLAGERCTVISVDAHVGPDLRRQLRGYCPKEHLDSFDDFVQRVEQGAAAQLSVDATRAVSQQAPQANREMLAARGKIEGLQDPHARLRDMDADGIAADVIYHGGLNGQPIPFYNFNIGAWGSPDFDHLESVGVRIYNRWLADFVSVAPERHVGVAHISVRDLPAAIEEVKWAREAGLTAVNLPAPRRDFTPYTEPDWEPLWDVCEDLEMTLATHGGGGDLEARCTGLPGLAMFILENPWMARRGMWQMIFGGVFERHPHLFLVPTEQFGDWVPATLREMDSAYRWPQLRAIHQALPNPPSYYFRSNCFIGSSFMSREEAAIGVEAGFVGNLMWGSDYPHPEGSYPYSTLALRKTLAGLGRDVIDAYVSKNAAHAYRVDLGQLSTVTDRIGPRYDELEEAYTSRPDDLPSTLAFREFGHWA